MRIGGRFAYWYNVKYQRVGHLFQDRFKSEPVDTTTYLLTVIRYIHQNPVKAGICERSKDYPYSSWREYLTEPWIADVSFTDTQINKNDLIVFHELLSMEQRLDITDTAMVRMTDEQAKVAMIKITGCGGAADFQKLTQINRDKAILKLRENQLSLRQISRLTGISTMVVRKIVQET